MIGLFCAFAGGLNLIDPGHILRLGVPLLALTGFSWGYVFGILMGRKEALALGFLASIGYVAAGVLKLGTDRPFALLLLRHRGLRPRRPDAVPQAYRRLTS